MGSTDKTPGLAFRISQMTGARAFPLLLLSVLLLMELFPASASDRLFGSFSSDLPASVRTVFFFDLRKLRESSFRPAGAGKSVPELLTSLEKMFSERGIDPGVASCAFFFAGGSAGLLLDSSLSPQSLAGSRTEGHDAAPAITETRTPDGRSVFLFNDSRGQDGKADDALACTFLARPGRLLVSTGSGLPPLMQETTGLSPELRAALEHLPGGAVLEGVLHPDFSGMPAESVSPLWNGVGRIVFSFSLKERDPYPFQGSVLFFPRTTAEAGTVRRNVMELVRSAYAAGREKGEIRPEMMFAFQVLPGTGFTELRIRLTGPDAEDFVNLFAAELSKGVSGK